MRHPLRWFCLQSPRQATVSGVTGLFPTAASHKDKNKKKRKSVVDEEPQPEGRGEPLPIDILTDTIVGFLEKGTAFLRTVANHSFSLLSARLKRSTIELILTVGTIHPVARMFWTQCMYDTAT